MSTCPNCLHEIHSSDATLHGYSGPSHEPSRCITLLRMDVEARKKKYEQIVAIVRGRAKRARERHAVDALRVEGDKFLDDSDLATFYDVLANEIEAL